MGQLNILELSPGVANINYMCSASAVKGISPRNSRSLISVDPNLPVILILISPLFLASPPRILLCSVFFFSRPATSLFLCLPKDCAVPCPRPAGVPPHPVFRARPPHRPRRPGLGPARPQTGYQLEPSLPGWVGALGGVCRRGFGGVPGLPLPAVGGKLVFYFSLIWYLTDCFIFGVTGRRM